MTSCLLTLSLPPAQESLLTDWLSESGLFGFSSWRGWGHTSDVGRMSLREQIQGKENRVFIAIHLDSDAADLLLQQLASTWPQLDVHFWIQPIIKAGKLNDLKVT